MSDREEIDFVIDEKKTCIQVCYGEIKERGAEGLQEFSKRFKRIMLTRDSFEVGEITKIPLWLFCFEPRMF